MALLFLPSERCGGGGLVAKLYPTLVTPWNVACQASLSMEFSREESWNGLPFPSPKVLPDPEIEPESPGSPASAGIFFSTAPSGKPYITLVYM